MIGILFLSWYSICIDLNLNGP